MLGKVNSAHPELENVMKVSCSLELVHLETKHVFMWSQKRQVDAC